MCSGLRESPLALAPEGRVSIKSPSKPAEGARVGTRQPDRWRSLWPATPRGRRAGSAPTPWGHPRPQGPGGGIRSVAIAGAPSPIRGVCPGALTGGCFRRRSITAWLVQWSDENPISSRAACCAASCSRPGARSERIDLQQRYERRPQVGAARREQFVRCPRRFLEHGRRVDRLAERRLRVDGRLQRGADT